MFSSEEHVNIQQISKNLEQQIFHNVCDAGENPREGLASVLTGKYMFM
jgi:hypothetical protein